MATNPTEAKNPDGNGAPPATPTKGSGFKAWLPLVLALALMPALAYAMTFFVLLPKLKKAIGSSSDSSGASPSESSPHGAGPDAAGGGKPKNKVQLSKIIVNVSGSGGTRLLLASLTLAGNAGDFKNKIDENSDELRDLAASALASKTIVDLERPESRNQIRSELLSQFNAALGQGVVQEIYITELAIQ